MTKAELVEEVSRVSDLTKKHSEVIVDTVFESIIDALKRGEKIELRGFGSFRLRKREPRKGRNPKTGDKVDVPPKRVPYFKPGKELKDLINKDTGERAGRRFRISDLRFRINRRSRSRLIRNPLDPKSEIDMDRIWSPWRHAYVTRSEDAPAASSASPGPSATGAQLIVHEGALAYVILNKFPYNAGHLMVVPHRHVAHARAARATTS